MLGRNIIIFRFLGIPRDTKQGIVGSLGPPINSRAGAISPCSDSIKDPGKDCRKRTCFGREKGNNRGVGFVLANIIRDPCSRDSKKWTSRDP